MKKVFFSVALLFIFVSQTFAQIVNDPTTWRYEVHKKSNNQYELAFIVKLNESWHVFSQNAGDDMLIPPSFYFDKNTAIKFIGKVKEQGKLKIEKMEGIDHPVRYYEGIVTFSQLVQAKPGAKIMGEHEYQVCNNSMCLPPKKKKFEFIIKD
ncbi:MAG: hypothetical protein JSS78_10870 [Bacteroidetes bacterium]|nr:hypothetical protein [Bacteroidota bacterium]